MEKFACWSRGNRSPGLCEACSKIDFDNLASTRIRSMYRTPKTTMTLLSLFDVIKNSREKTQHDETLYDPSVRNTECKLCTLLFDTIALPRHDPFEHPAMKEHMPDKFKNKTFETWAQGIKWHDRIFNVPHPFGQGRERIKILQDKTDPTKIIEFRNRNQETADQLGVVAGAGAAGAVTQAGTQARGRDRQVLSIFGKLWMIVTSAASLMDHRMPVGVALTLHNHTDDNAGVLNVKVFGYGSKVQASLSNLSEFNLRVTSKYEVQNDGLNLRYGRILEDMIKVEGDCYRWLNHCRESHGDLCEQPDWSSGLPFPSGDHFRLIDVFQARVVPFQVSSDGSNVPVYAALSYVWGEAGKMALNLTRENLWELERGIDDLIPNQSQQHHVSHGRQKRVAQTIRDAVQVARRLCIRFLWVDSLCVIQNSEHDDWKDPAQQQQIKQMDSIFGHATVVIIAANGEDAEAGLAGISVPRNPGQTAREIKDGVNILLPVQYDDSYGYWDTRAWTFQEKLLSKRMLVFGTNHVSFHCRQGILREDMPAAHAGNGPPQIPHLSMPPGSGESPVGETWDGKPVLLRSPFFNEYAKLLEQYTGRNMSNPGDILDGIQGLLRVLENMRDIHPVPSPGSIGTLLGVGGHTLFGLPEEFLDVALLWQPPAVKGTYLIKRENVLLPSWSWAGWQVAKGQNSSGYQETGKNYKAYAGVRYEQPFWVSGNDDMSLRKFIATERDAEERFKPLIMWYKYLHGLVPVNGNGIGYVCGSERVDRLCMQKALRSRGMSIESPAPPYVPSNIPLDNRHLVCETEEAIFRLRAKGESRKELLWKRLDGVAKVEKELDILEAEIFDKYKYDAVVGYVIFTDQEETDSTYAADEYHFILLSESQYWGNEKRVDIVGSPLYNVMLIKWDDKRTFARRIGMGKIMKPAWEDAAPIRKLVILE